MSRRSKFADSKSETEIDVTTAKGTDGKSSTFKMFGYFMAAVSAVMYGLAPFMASFINASGTGLSFLRVSLTLPLIAVCNLIKGEKFKIKRKEALVIAALAVLESVLTTTLLFESYNHIDTSVATTLNFSYPIIVLVLGIVLYKEKAGVHTFVSFALCSVGILLFCNTANGFTWKGFILALGSGVAYGSYVLFLDKSKILESVSFWTFTFWFFLFATVIMLPVAFSLGAFPIKLEFSGWLWVLVFVVTNGILGTICLQVGIQKIGSRKASLICAVEPVTSLLAGCLFLSEVLSVRSVLGVACVLAATSYLIITRDKV